MYLTWGAGAPGGTHGVLDLTLKFMPPAEAPRRSPAPASRGGPPAGHWPCPLPAPGRASVARVPAPERPPASALGSCEWSLTSPSLSPALGGNHLSHRGSSLISKVVSPLINAISRPEAGPKRGLGAKPGTPASSQLSDTQILLEAASKLELSLELFLVPGALQWRCPA